MVNVKKKIKMLIFSTIRENQTCPKLFSHEYNLKSAFNMVIGININLLFSITLKLLKVYLTLFTKYLNDIIMVSTIIFSTIII